MYIFADAAKINVYPDWIVFNQASPEDREIEIERVRDTEAHLTLILTACGFKEPSL
jgi:hypothetical protein